nr:zinc finger, CCHC-type [Tanacetum cinerariifolium]
MKKPFNAPLTFLEKAFDFVAKETDLFKNESSVVKDVNGLVKEKVDAEEKKRKERSNGAGLNVDNKRVKEETSTSTSSAKLIQEVKEDDNKSLRGLDYYTGCLGLRDTRLALRAYSLDMTTSSANNSVFRGFFKKEKLTGPNFVDWYRQLRIILSIEDKLNYLEQPIPLAPVALEGQQVALEILAAHTAWIKGSKEIELKPLFAQHAEQEPLQTTRDFHSCKQKEGQSVSSYVLKIKGYIDNLERLGHPVTLGLGVSLILIGLRREFDGFVQNYNMHSLGKIINEFHAMLKLHEQTLPKNNAPALHAIRAGKVQKVNKQKKPQPQMAIRGQNHGKGKNKLAYAPKPKIPD